MGQLLPGGPVVVPPVLTDTRGPQLSFEPTVQDGLLLALRGALDQLNTAASALHTQTTVPHTPVPTPRRFRIAPGWDWPLHPSLCATPTPFMGITQILAGRYLSHTLNSVALPSRLIETLGAQPRRVLGAIKQLQRAAQWCDERVEGRQRQAAALLADQDPAWRQIQALAVVEKARNDERS